MPTDIPGIRPDVDVPAVDPAGFDDTGEAVGIDEILLALEKRIPGLRELLIEWNSDSLGHGAHRVASRLGTEALGTAYGPQTGTNIMDLIGLTRESITGAKGMWSGEPFFTPTGTTVGFDWGDIGANREGQEQGRDAIAQNPLMAGLSRGIPGITIPEQAIKLIMQLAEGQ